MKKDKEKSIKSLTKTKKKGNENWKVIPDHADYLVSSMGRVRSLAKRIRRIDGTTMNVKGQLLKPDGSMGYYRVVVDRKRFLIHRLVAMAFIPNDKEKPQINHIDCNKLNNSVENLEWCTNLENRKHAEKHGLVRYVRGEEQGKSKLSNQQVITIRELYSIGKSNMEELGRRFKVSPENIKFIVSGKTWKHLL